MNRYYSEIYNNTVKRIAELPFNWEPTKYRSFAISGATGMIGTFMVDVLMYRNDYFNQNSDIYVFGRSEDKAKKRFGKNYYNERFHFCNQDINLPITLPMSVDYVIHAASNTHPVAYSSDPIGTISANVIGTDNLLTWASEHNCERFVFLSSVEVYGENKGDIDKFTEDYLGYIDCNTLRAGYPESKRTGEALCQAYIAQKGMDVVIPRLSRVYGPTMLMSDTKAISQFILNGVNNNDIVLKSEGTQLFSYSYVADAVSAIFKILIDGQSGEVYNVASDNSDVMLKELAQIISEYNHKSVVFDLPNEQEKKGYSKATKATLDVTKLKKLGWESLYDINTGLNQTIDVLKGITWEE